MNTKENVAVTTAVLQVHSAIGQHLIAHYNAIPPKTNVIRLIFPQPDGPLPVAITHIIALDMFYSLSTNMLTIMHMKSHFKYPYLSYSESLIIFEILLHSIYVQ